jgi:hypothetical protein
MNNVGTQLQEFRQAIYNNLRKAQDATFELMDALLLTSWGGDKEVYKLDLIRVAARIPC